MFVFAVGVMPPLYDVICEVTGLNGKVETRPAADSDSLDMDRKVVIQLISKSSEGMPWDFAPEVTRLEVHPGEIKKVSYHALNPTGSRIVGQAIPSVSPNSATRYFKKTQCFCFAEQALAGGESADMPLIFYVDPELPAYIKEITLSYELFDITDRASAGAVALN
jgi:cytochrome c oxidase assembly protein subunit 11